MNLDGPKKTISKTLKKRKEQKKEKRRKKKEVDMIPLYIFRLDSPLVLVVCCVRAQSTLVVDL